MKLLFAILLMSAFSAHALPGMTVKERLRLNLWAQGLEDKPIKKVSKASPKPLPEELERALRKI